MPAAESFGRGAARARGFAGIKPELERAPRNRARSRICSSLRVIVQTTHTVSIQALRDTLGRVETMRGQSTRCVRRPDCSENLRRPVSLHPNRAAAHSDTRPHAPRINEQRAPMPQHAPLAQRVRSNPPARASPVCSKGTSRACSVDESAEDTSCRRSSDRHPATAAHMRCRKYTRTNRSAPPPNREEAPADSSHTKVEARAWPQLRR